LEGEHESDIWAPSVVMLSCEQAANQTWIGAPDPDYCFTGTQTRGMSDEEFEILSNMWARQKETIVSVQMA
jgi:hypothetical protein